jgi:hypothetical protein
MFHLIAVAQAASKRGTATSPADAASQSRLHLRAIKQADFEHAGSYVDDLDLQSDAGVCFALDCIEKRDPRNILGDTVLVTAVNSGEDLRRPLPDVFVQQGSLAVWHWINQGGPQGRAGGLAVGDVMKVRLRGIIPINSTPPSLTEADFLAMYQEEEEVELRCPGSFMVARRGGPFIDKIPAGSPVAKRPRLEMGMDGGNTGASPPPEASSTPKSASMAGSSRLGVRYAVDHDGNLWDTQGDNSNLGQRISNAMLAARVCPSSKHDALGLTRSYLIRPAEYLRKLRDASSPYKQFPPGEEKFKSAGLLGSSMKDAPVFVEMEKFTAALTGVYSRWDGTLALKHFHHGGLAAFNPTAAHKGSSPAFRLKVCESIQGVEDYFVIIGELAYVGSFAALIQYIKGYDNPLFQLPNIYIYDACNQLAADIFTGLRTRVQRDPRQKMTGVIAVRQLFDQQIALTLDTFARAVSSDGVQIIKHFLDVDLPSLPLDSEEEDATTVGTAATGGGGVVATEPLQAAGGATVPPTGLCRANARFTFRLQTDDCDKGACPYLHVSRLKKYKLEEMKDIINTSALSPATKQELLARATADPKRFKQ